MKNTLAPALLALLISPVALAQTTPPTSGSGTYQFTSGLIALTGSRYGREAIYTDPLAYQLYTQTL